MEKIFLSFIRLSRIQFFFHVNFFFRLLGILKMSVTETLLYQDMYITLLFHWYITY
jgi:hypothetical protein